MTRKAPDVLWIMAILVVATLVGAEWWARHRLVQAAADRIATKLEADVELHVVGRPLAWQLARRHLPQVVLIATDLPVLHGKAALRHLRVELNDVRLEGLRDARRITAGAGRFDLQLDDDELLEMVALPPFLLSFEIVPTGLRLSTLPGVVVDARLELVGADLKVRAEAPGVLRLMPYPTFWLPLPRWPYGAVVEDMLLHTGWLEAWGSLDPDKLDFPVPRPERDHGH